MFDDTFLQDNYKEIFLKYRWFIIIGTIALIFIFAVLLKGATS